MRRVHTRLTIVTADPSGPASAWHRKNVTCGTADSRTDGNGQQLEESHVSKTTACLSPRHFNEAAAGRCLRASARSFLDRDFDRREDRLLAHVLCLPFLSLSLSVPLTIVPLLDAESVFDEPAAFLQVLSWYRVHSSICKWRSADRWS